MKLCCDLPGHSDDSPSLAVYSDHAYCYGCQTWEGWLEHCRRRGLYADNLAGPAPLAHLVVKSSSASSSNSSAATLTEEELRVLVQFYHERLCSSPDKLQWLNARGLSLETCTGFALGYTGRAFTIPIWDGPSLRTIRFRRDDTQDTTGNKYWGMKGRNDVYLYAPVGFGPKVVITEGEYDCLIAVQAGYCAVTVTNGIGSFTLDSWLERFTEVKELVIATDQDGPGYLGGLGLKAQMLPHIPTVTLPRFRAKDLSDLYCARGLSGVQQVLGAP